MDRQIHIYQSEDGQISLQVALNEETLWLTQAQMAELFGVKVQNITMHLQHIFQEQELDEDSTCKDFLKVQREGKRQVKRSLKHYNLDAIISVGYRISSKRATQFRQWATGVLRQFLVQGYALNERRLQEKGVEFNQVLQLLSQTLVNQALVADQGQAVLAVVRDYAKTWSLLQAYDEQNLAEITRQQADMRPLHWDEVLEAIGQLKEELRRKGEATDLFGQLRSDGLASALATIEQGFGDRWLYPNVASRAAHLLYFVIKNHPLADGNKRVGSFLFLCYLHRNQPLLAKPVAQLINENTLVALALLVAESAPAQKELMIKLVEHFIEMPAINGPNAR